MHISHRLKFENSQKLIKSSMTFKIYMIIRNFLFNAPLIKYFFNPYRLAPLWYNSFLFCLAKTVLKRIYPLINLLTSIFNTAALFSRHRIFEHITGFSILISALVPDLVGAFHIYIIFIPLIILWSFIFITKNKTGRQATNFTAIIIVFGIFYAVYASGFKSGAYFGLILLVPFLFFIIASLSLSERSDVNIINSYCIISLLILSAIVISTAILRMAPSKTLTRYVNIIALLSPLAVSRAIDEKNKIKKTLYISAVVIFSLIAVILYGSTICRISYFISILLIIVFIKPKILLYILLLAPAIIKLTASFLINSLNSQIKHDTPVENIISISRNLWNNSLGSGYKPFLNIYSSFTDTSLRNDNLLHSYINEGYLRAFYNLGFILIFIFIWFSLRAMRKCLTEVFKKHSNEQITAVCKVAFLISASISGFVGSNVTSLSIASLYWLILASVTKNYSSQKP